MRGPNMRAKSSIWVPTDWVGDMSLLLNEARSTVNTRSAPGA